jgi:hypothetical protein
MEWTPITADELRDVVVKQLVDLDAETQAVWDHFGTQPTQILCIRGRLDGDVPELEPIYAVARAGDEVLIYDDVEDEWGIGVMDADGVLRSWGTYGEQLHWTLKTFPSPRVAH